MTIPSKTSPVRALIHAKVCIEADKLTLFQKETLGIIEAALPIAELHEQAVERLTFINDRKVASEEWWLSTAELFDNLDALSKDNPSDLNKTGANERLGG